eukprot:TRINITY_DN61506_c0_g1_i1.p1 TRINITY_DN61506_c0_g1~~TRINITY_DN61506_c0_g1_i1.p1  ORF type:complete len:496 (-),score=124.47 TRINITY_DN61506_c0_g1_i1:94-1581(-)
MHREKRERSDSYDRKDIQKPKLSGFPSDILPPEDPNGTDADATIVSVHGRKIRFRKEATMRDKKSDEVGRDYEIDGLLTFDILHNDGSFRSLFALTALRNVYGQQLPNMPKEYISRLVFDPRHESIIALHKGSVIGGITYRPFDYEGGRFGEIAFCAVFNPEDQEQRGVGARLMNHLKMHCLTVRIDRFLTYADDLAVGFFKKQGFSKTITLPHELWRGKIKDYEKATLMECVFREKVDYEYLPDIVHAQRQHILNMLELHPGLTWEADPDDAGDKAREGDSLTPAAASFGMRHRTRRSESSGSIGVGGGMGGGGGSGTADEGKEKIANSIVRTPSDIPGVTSRMLQRSMPPPPTVFSTMNAEEKKRARDTMKKFVEDLKSHRDAWPFLDSIEVIMDAYPGYLNRVRYPIDLEMIAMRVNDEMYYRSYDQFLTDIVTMLKNCMRFNTERSEYGKAARSMVTWTKEQCTRMGLLSLFEHVHEQLRFIYDPENPNQD